MLTKLEAVNLMLTAIRERPVNTLEGPLNEEVSQALTTLDDISRQVQVKGFKFNTDVDVELLKDGNNNISVPADTLAVSFDPRYETNKLKPTQRGTQVYNSALNTAVFSASERVFAKHLIRNLDWDLLPYPARQAIAMRAARVFVTKYASDPTAIQSAAFEERQAFAELERHYSLDAKPNMLRDNDFTLYGLNRY